ncbi:Uncharacterised protein [Yersinia pekkanenii]|uniref:Uncharacterized protein n=1 Tax=Yersinia pekkanenii TaxID=1288385 RepID=A0A0T9Q9L8_9GAMM|nr:Uncharacterised protein [Yersinia pekkanenii]CRY63658.1 Uncharacterised protein [Yersinia pekkanenii]
MSFISAFKGVLYVITTGIDQRNYFHTLLAPSQEDIIAFLLSPGWGKTTRFMCCLGKWLSVYLIKFFSFYLD